MPGKPAQTKKRQAAIDTDLILLLGREDEGAAMRAALLLCDGWKPSDISGLVRRAFPNGRVSPGQFNALADAFHFYELGTEIERASAIDR